MTSYYGGEQGNLFERLPCAAGGAMSPDAAKTYQLPKDRSKDPIPGEGTANLSNASSSFYNHTHEAQYYYANQQSADPIVGKAHYHARDEASSDGGSKSVQHFKY